MRSSVCPVLSVALVVGLMVFLAGPAPAVASFFDVFTEISLDSTGAVHYYPPLAAKQEVTLQNMHLGNQQFVSSNPNTGMLVSSFFDVFFDISIPNVTFSPSGQSAFRFTEVLGQPPDPVRLFDTEMLSLSLTGGGTLMIRESPTLASTGQTHITDLGGGLFRIDSFFDVFTELSIDGQTWTAGDAPLRMSGSNVPEPSSLIAWSLLGASGIGARWWRRRKQAA